ncbi:hypothetical protein [Corynebacterium caspium]|uniref:hypothetical protein n=1 Tax=Corynebacterium caspium TaxID=234828 RepID=UPI00039B997C|nr:hypothetical protein [Corynebacterium caspium]
MAMTLRLSPAHDRALHLLAQAQGCSKHEAALRAIVAAASQMLEDAHISELARRSLNEYVAAEQRLHPRCDL